MQGINIEGQNKRLRLLDNITPVNFQNEDPRVAIARLPARVQPTLADVANPGCGLSSPINSPTEQTSGLHNPLSSLSLSKLTDVAKNSEWVDIRNYNNYGGFIGSDIGEWYGHLPIQIHANSPKRSLGHSSHTTKDDLYKNFTKFEICGPSPLLWGQIVDRHNHLRRLAAGDIQHSQMQITNNIRSLAQNTSKTTRLVPLCMPKAPHATENNKNKINSPRKSQLNRVVDLRSPQAYCKVIPVSIPAIRYASPRQTPMPPGTSTPLSTATSSTILRPPVEDVQEEEIDNDVSLVPTSPYSPAVKQALDKHHGLSKLSGMLPLAQTQISPVNKFKKNTVSTASPIKTTKNIFNAVARRKKSNEGEVVYDSQKHGSSDPAIEPQTPTWLLRNLSNSTPSSSNSRCTISPVIVPQKRHIDDSPSAERGKRRSMQMVFEGGVGREVPRTATPKGRTSSTGKMAVKGGIGHLVPIKATSKASIIAKKQKSPASFPQLATSTAVHVSYENGWLHITHPALCRLCSTDFMTAPTKSANLSNGKHDRKSSAGSCPEVPLFQPRRYFRRGVEVREPEVFCANVPTNASGQLKNSVPQRQNKPARPLGLCINTITIFISDSDTYKACLGTLQYASFHPDHRVIKIFPQTNTAFKVTAPMGTNVVAFIDKLWPGLAMQADDSGKRYLVSLGSPAQSSE